MSDYQPAPPPSTPYTGAPAPARSPIFSILSLVGGIVGVLLSFFFGAGLLFGAAGVVLGFIGRRKEPQARGMWLTGIILGFIAVAISLIFILIGIIAAIAISSSAYHQ